MKKTFVPILMLSMLFFAYSQSDFYLPEPLSFFSLCYSDGIQNLPDSLLSARHGDVKSIIVSSSIQDFQSNEFRKFEPITYSYNLDGTLSEISTINDGEAVVTVLEYINQKIVKVTGFTGTTIYSYSYESDKFHFNRADELNGKVDLTGTGSLDPLTGSFLWETETFFSHKQARFELINDQIIQIQVDSTRLFPRIQPTQRLTYNYEYNQARLLINYEYRRIPEELTDSKKYDYNQEGNLLGYIGIISKNEGIKGSFSEWDEKGNWIVQNISITDSSGVITRNEEIRRVINYYK